MASKQQRHLEIARLIESHVVTSQPQLVDLLAEVGVKATQATVSRDLDELGAIKVRTGSGDTAYAIPELPPERKAPAEHLRRVMSEWVAVVGHSGKLVVMARLGALPIAETFPRIVLNELAIFGDARTAPSVEQALRLRVALHVRRHVAAKRLHASARTLHNGGRCGRRKSAHPPSGRPTW